MSHPKKLLLFLIVSFLIYFWLNSLITVPDWDALSYIMNGKALAGDQKYYEWHRPILWPLLLGINFLVFGFNELIPRILGSLLSTLTLFAIYKIGAEIHSERIGWYSMLAFFFLPLVVYWAPRMYTAIPCIGLISASMYFLIKYTKTEDSRNMILFGVFSSLAFLIRYVGAGSLIIGIIYLVYKSKLNKDLLKALVSFMLVSAPFFYFNWVNTGSLFYSMSIANYQMAEFQPTRLDYYVRNSMIIFTPPFLLLFGIALLDALRLVKNSRKEITVKKDDGMVLALLLFGFYLLYFQAWLNLKDLRYIIPVFLGFSLFCGKGFDVLINFIYSRSKRFDYAPHFLVVLGLAAIVAAAPEFFTSCDQYVSIGSYLSSLPDGNVVSPAWPYYNYYSDKTVKWAPHTYGDLLNETQKFGVKYAVMTAWPSEPGWAYSGYFDERTDFRKIQEFTGCLGTVSVYEYLGTVSGELNKREQNVVNSNAFIPLRLVP